MRTKNEIYNWIDQQHCMKVIVPPGQTTYPPGDTTTSYYSSRHVHLDLMYQSYFHYRHPRRLADFTAIWENTANLNTQHAPYPWNFTSTLHPHICCGWGLLQRFVRVVPGGNFVCATWWRFSVSVVETNDWCIYISRILIKKNICVFFHCVWPTCLYM